MLRVLPENTALGYSAYKQYGPPVTFGFRTDCTTIQVPQQEVS